MSAENTHPTITDFFAATVREFRGEVRNQASFSIEEAALLIRADRDGALRAE